jgi:hypothetical protein
MIDLETGKLVDFQMLNLSDFFGFAEDTSVY